MIVTPQETLIKGIAQLTGDTKINGSVAEIHGNSVTLRPPHEYVDEATHSNLETFWKLGVA